MSGWVELGDAMRDTCIMVAAMAGKARRQDQIGPGQVYSAQLVGGPRGEEWFAPSRSSTLHRGGQLRPTDTCKLKCLSEGSGSSFSSVTRYRRTRDRSPCSAHQRPIYTLLPYSRSAAIGNRI
jgi:hypothetical protein